jgi:hypothetical protein
MLSCYSVLPVIATEGEQRQSGSIGHIAQLPVAETVAHGYRLLHLVAAHLYTFVPVATARLPEVLVLGGVEYVVLACHLEALDELEAADGAVGSVEV